MRVFTYTLTNHIAFVQDMSEIDGIQAGLDTCLTIGIGHKGEWTAHGMTPLRIYVAIVQIGGEFLYMGFFNT